MPRLLPPRIVFGVALALAGALDLHAQTTAYTGATVWDGTGAPSRPDVTILVEDGRIAAIGSDVSVPAAARTVSLDGKFVIPGLVNAHGHVTGGWATDPSASEEERIREDLRLYARYGVTSVNSLGDGYAALEVAREAHEGRGHARLLAQLTESGVCYVPTLTREVSTFVYGNRPDFFDDPYFRRFALAREVRRLEQPQVQRQFRESESAEGYRRALPRAEANLVTLHEAGVPIAFGTDSGPPARFPGYFEHMELWMMVDAGLTPVEALRSATAVATDCSGFTDVGTLEAGQWADFLVLGEDPTTDIEATRSLERVFVGGQEVPMEPGG